MDLSEHLPRKSTFWAAAGFLAAWGIPGCQGAAGATVTPDFSAAQFVAGAAIDNKYFPLGPSYKTTVRAAGIDQNGDPINEESRLSYGGPGRVILGIETTVQRDLAFEGDLLVEDTFDYYAQDTVGNVWYLGEDVTNYVYDDNDVLIETNSASSWIAGENGALPGWIMPADPMPGFSYFQEVAAADNALDEAMIFATGLTLFTGGVLYQDVLSTLETSALDPTAREFKFYAPDIGLIRVEEGLDENFTNPELVFQRVSTAAVPLPASLPLLLGAAFGIFGLKRRKSGGALPDAV